MHDWQDEGASGNDVSASIASQIVAVLPDTVVPVAATAMTCQ
jgi:hypothetical protein